MGHIPPPFFHVVSKPKEKSRVLTCAARRETSGGDLFARAWGERINFVVT